MRQHHINFGFGLRDFNDYGINFLTGEACGYGGRILIDLTPEGADLMEEFLGTTIRRGNAWNNGEASMMYPRGAIADLAIFCLIKDGNAVVVLRNDYIALGFTEEEWLAEDENGLEFRTRYFAAYPNCKTYFNSGTAGTRNRHEMSGRVE